MSCETAIGDFFVKGQGADEIAFVVQGNQLQVDLSEMEGVSPSPSVATLRTKPSRLKRSTSACMALTSRGSKKSATAV